MYEIVKNVIQSGRYELSDMLKKIDVIWLQGDLTDEQKTELVSLAQSNADPENSYASVQKQIDNLYVNMTEMGQAILDLTNRVTTLEGGKVPEVPEEEWPEWKAPTGAHDAYKVGDKITFKGKHYVCKMNGCVWSPEVYPDGWEAAE